MQLAIPHRGKWPRIAISTIDKHVGDNTLQEASISLVNWRTDIEALAERALSGTAVPIFDRHPSHLDIDLKADDSAV